MTTNTDNLENIRIDNLRCETKTQEKNRVRKFINQRDIDDFNNRAIESPISPKEHRSRLVT